MILRVPSGLCVSVGFIPFDARRGKELKGEIRDTLGKYGQICAHTFVYILSTLLNKEKKLSLWPIYNFCSIFFFFIFMVYFQALLYS